MINYRKAVEEKILFILLTYKSELISDNTNVSTFDIMRKHALGFEDFSEKIHQDVYKAILNQMHKGHKAVEPISLVDFRPKEYQTFDRQSNEFLQIIVNLKNTAFGTFSELDGLIYKLKEFVLATYFVSLGQKCMSTNFQAIDVIKFGQEMIDNYTMLYTRMTSGIIQSDSNSADDLKAQLIDKKRKADMGIIGGIPIAVKSIQEIMNGFNEPDLFVIGARPSMGKTETAISMAWECAQQGYPTTFVSIEMGEIQLVNKVVNNLTGIGYDNLKHGTLTPEQFNMALDYYDKVKKSNLNIVSSKYKSIDLLETKLRDLHKLGKVKICFIDYLQLMTTSAVTGGNRDQFIGNITGRLKALCLELSIPIVLLCQLSREAAKRTGPPTLTDLRESGNIEQDADIVAFIHRGVFYEANYDSLPYNEQFKTDWIVRKHRGGSLGSAKYFQDVKNSRLLDI